MLPTNASQSFLSLLCSILLGNKGRSFVCSLQEQAKSSFKTSKMQLHKRRGERPCYAGPSPSSPHTQLPRAFMPLCKMRP